jgi:HAD superfamily hydrolase (TIGR01459 family)
MTSDIKTPPHLGLEALSSRYDVVLCDVWGVVHNGVSAWPTALDALIRFRSKGGTVILVSNAPRPNGDVIPQLDSLNVPREAWDDLITSGDVTRHEIVARKVKKVHHIGPERDKGLLEELDVKSVGIQEAELAVVTGLDDDDTETPDDYTERLAVIYARELPMICANPDRIVEKGNRIIWCAGALADMYEDMGGNVVFAGKPYRPIYELAWERAENLRGKKVELSHMLAIGDAVRTDLLGAKTFGIDSLFITGGIHGADVGTPVEPAKLQHILEQGSCSPIGWARRLVWEQPR